MFSWPLLCPESHTSIRAVIIIVSTPQRGALILTWVVLSQVTHCCFALNRKWQRPLLLLHLELLLMWRWIADRQQTAHTFSSNINQTYTTTLPVWCPSFHPQFLDRFVLVHSIFAYFLVWTHSCSQTCSVFHTEVCDSCFVCLLVIGLA